MTLHILDDELRTFRLHKPAWLATGLEGQWVAIRGRTIGGPHPDDPTALRAAYATFGPGPFLVRRIERIETVHGL